MSEEEKKKTLGELDSGRRGILKGLAFMGTAVAASSILPLDEAQASKKKASKKKASKKKKRSKKKASKKKVAKKKA